MSILKVIGVPGSITFLLMCCAVAVALQFVWPRNRRLARRWLVLVFGLYVLMGVPIVANAIAGRLPRTPALDAGATGPLETLIVFDGDNRRGRVRQASAVYRTAAPQVVWLLGGQWMNRALLESGIPAARLSVDASSPTTRDQMMWVEKHLASGPRGRTAIVASRLQIPRIAALAAAAKLDVRLVPSPIDTEPPTAGPWLFVPTYTALRVSRDALYELVALKYYAWRNWIR